MTKGPSFADDLAEVKSSVDEDVTDILQAAKFRQDQKLRAVARATTSAAETTAAKVSGEGTSPTRSKPAVRGPRQVPSDEAAVVLQNVTTRLRRETNELLTEATLRQRLKKVAPDTRQDIVEAALTEWFKRHGYGRSRKSEEEPATELAE